MKRIFTFLKEKLLLKNRYLLLIELVLLFLVMFIVLPSFILDLKPYGLDKTYSYSRPKFKESWLKWYNELQFRPGGNLTPRKRYIFGFEDPKGVSKTE